MASSTPATPPSPAATSATPAATGYRSVYRPGLFAGQAVWVTGGGSGIGRCVAHELAALGAQVIISGRSADKLERVASEITDDGGRCAGRGPRLRHRKATT